MEERSFLEKFEEEICSTCKNKPKNPDACDILVSLDGSRLYCRGYEGNGKNCKSREQL